MFDIAPTELLLVALVALVVIGPKDLPKAMRVVGNWVARARGVARHFRSGLDEMIRQSELEDMQKKWAAENERIMREHKTDGAAASDYAAERADDLADAAMTPLPPPLSPEYPAPGAAGEPADKRP